MLFVMSRTPRPVRWPVTLSRAAASTGERVRVTLTGDTSTTLVTRGLMLAVAILVILVKKLVCLDAFSISWIKLLSTGILGLRFLECMIE